MVSPKLTFSAQEPLVVFFVPEPLILLQLNTSEGSDCAWDNKIKSKQITKSEIQKKKKKSIKKSFEN